MFFIQSLRKKALKRINGGRSVVFHSFAMAKRVSFCFSYNEEGIEDTILKFTEFLKSNSISYSGIGTVMQKTKKQIIHMDENISVIQRLDCNYYGLPAQHKTSKLFVNEFDIFVDFNPTESFIQTYVALKTNAKFKIGRFSSENSPFDFVLEPGSEGTKPASFLNQIFHYLTQIRPA
jgi:hypothetical protein